MADITGRVTRRSIKAKKKAAIKTIKLQAKEKIKEVKLEYTNNPERKKAKEMEKAHKQELRIQKENARLAYNARQPRQFSLAEDIVNSLLCGIGAGLGVAALVLLIIRGALIPGFGEGISRARIITSYAIFGSSLFLVFLMATLYHAIQSLYARKIFSSINHCAIYYLIAGTYTPFILSKIPGRLGIYVGVFVWVVCAVLAFLYILFGRKMRSFSILSYIVCGWLIVQVFTYYPLGTSLPVLSKNLLFAGGACYTAGGIFFLFRKYKWTRTVFYVCAIAASVLHFFSAFFIY